ncbi:hypothetical protein EDB84DRAFT_1443350 [Lactarius hengduanensis]|nr:hypothetical protein EDB84DRAFT_1443350 [Lactarius hengduanensis]
MLTSNTGRTGTISASKQSVAEVYAVSPQPIPIAPPACAVVRASHVKDDPRSTGPLADMTVGTALAFASSKASPVFDTSCEVSTTPYLLTSTSSSIGGVASRDSTDLRIVPTHAVPDTSSPSLPISVPGNTISTYTHSFTISSMSRSDHIPSWTGSLARHDSTVLPQQASLVPATIPEFSQPLRGTRPSPQDTDRSGRSRTSTTR